MIKPMPVVMKPGPNPSIRRTMASVYGTSDRVRSSFNDETIKWIKWIQIYKRETYVNWINVHHLNILEN